MRKVNTHAEGRKSVESGERGREREESLLRRAGLREEKGVRETEECAE